MAVPARLIVTLAAALTLAGSAPAAGERLAGHRVPAGVREVDIRSSRGISRRVAEPARVARIVRWFDALPRLRHTNVRYFCPMIRAGSPVVRFAFRGASGRVLARARVLDAFRGISGRCNAIQFTVPGHRKQPLIGGRLLLRVQRLLGVRLG
jgi:hypothetical protein